MNSEQMDKQLEWTGLDQNAPQPGQSWKLGTQQAHQIHKRGCLCPQLRCL